MLKKKKLSKKLVSKWSLKKPLYLLKTDERYAKHAKQLKTNGFSDSETWSLYEPITEFVLPRLIRFREIRISNPIGLTPEEWDGIIGEMIFAFDWSLNSDDYSKLTVKEVNANWKRYQKGMNLFAKWFQDLWW